MATESLLPPLPVPRTVASISSYPCSCAATQSRAQRLLGKCPAARKARNASRRSLPATATSASRSWVSKCPWTPSLALTTAGNPPTLPRYVPGNAYIHYRPPRRPTHTTANLSPRSDRDRRSCVTRTLRASSLFRSREAYRRRRRSALDAPELIRALHGPADHGDGPQVDAHQSTDLRQLSCRVVWGQRSPAAPRTSPSSPIVYHPRGEDHARPRVPV
uniref:Uncharacterized protein n=1 Tax=Mycena chlorophos TaxID=658473 RepID=A0ABQ0L419_MYCCL|nr:predicted protein [Mycena chlorophos]